MRDHNEREEGREWGWPNRGLPEQQFSPHLPPFYPDANPYPLFDEREGPPPLPNWGERLREIEREHSSGRIDERFYGHGNENDREEGEIFEPPPIFFSRGNEARDHRRR